MIQAKCCKVRDETIEKYAMGRMSQQSLARFEEHLLLCESCQNQVTLTDGYLQAMRNALQTPGPVAEERRRAPRLECGESVAVRLRGDGNSIWAKTTDRSDGGFGLTLGVKLRKGARVVLALGRSLHEGRVAWCASQGTQYRIGIQLSA